MFLDYSISAITINLQHFILSLHVVTSADGILKITATVASHCTRQYATIYVYILRLLYVTMLLVLYKYNVYCSSRTPKSICCVAQSPIEMSLSKQGRCGNCKTMGLICRT